MIVKAQKKADIREQAFYAFADAKIPILEMGTSGRSLEEVFLELTNQDAAEAESGLGTSEETEERKEAE